MPGSNQEYSFTVSQVSFHVFRRICGSSRIPLYTIGVWEGTVQRAICHDACFACALAAILREVENSAHTAKSSEAPDPNDQGKPTWLVQYATTVHASSEDEALHLGERDVATGNCTASVTRS